MTSINSAYNSHRYELKKCINMLTKTFSKVSKLNSLILHSDQG